MASNDYSTIEDYISDQPIETQSHLKKLRLLILKVAPNATELFNYNIPAFSLIQEGKREQQIMMAGYKKHVGLYPHPTTMEKFWNELEGYKKAKGSLQFPLNKPLPEELICEMVRYRLNLLTQK